MPTSTFPHVLVSGLWGEGDVLCRVVPSTRQTNQDIEREVELIWRRLLDEGLPLHDGPMCRLERWELCGTRAGGSAKPDDGESASGAGPVDSDSAGGATVDASGPILRLDVSRTSYKAFAGTNLHGRGDLPHDCLARPIGVSPALETADGFLLFGRRSDRVAYYPHRLHPFSGALEWPADGERPDIFAECRRELAEELSLAAAEVPELAVLGIVEDQAIRHPEVILHARTTRTRADLEARLDPTEHSGLVAIPATTSAIDHALRRPEFTPVARAALRLYAQTT